MKFPVPRQWEWAAVVPIVAGFFWLFGDQSPAWVFWGIIPGTLLLSTGVAMLLIPGDPRINSYMALTGFIGVVLALPLWYVGGFGLALIAALLAIGSLLVAGRVGVKNEPLHEGAEPPQLDRKMDFKAALDEAVLGYFVGTAQVPSGDEAETMCREALQLAEVMDNRGWSTHPETYHQTPEAPQQVRSESKRVYGIEFEQVSFDSGYVPDPAMPGAQLWSSYDDNNRCVARVLRHPGPPRPWLMTIHGYRMGEAWMDFGLFSPGYLHHKLGLNVIMPMLPLHGPRRIGKRTGDYYLDGDLLDLLFAQTQALWDLRRWLAWLRATESNPSIGVYGISLGGYNASLLAGYESDLDFVVAGIPVIDLPSTLWRVIPPMHKRYIEAAGLPEARYRDILHAVSPLARPPLPSRDRLHIFAAAGDRIVLPPNPVLLGQHWNVPVTWFQGSHLSIRREAEPRRVLEEAMLGAGWRIGAYATA